MLHSLDNNPFFSWLLPLAVDLAVSKMVKNIREMFSSGYHSKQNLGSNMKPQGCKSTTLTIELPCLFVREWCYLFVLMLICVVSLFFVLSVLFTCSCFFMLDLLSVLPTHFWIMLFTPTQNQNMTFYYTFLVTLC